MTWVVAVATTAVVVPGLEALVEDGPEWVGHGAGHAWIGLVAAGICVMALRRWPPARSVGPGRLGRGLVVAALVGVAAGQVLEVVGARVDEPGAATFEVWAHTAGQVVSMLGMLVLAAGGALSAVAAARDRRLPVWAGVGLAAAGALVLAVLFVGLPGGG